MPICQVPGCEEHYGCRLRNKGILLSPRATSTRTQNMKPSPMPPPSINAQIMYDERPGGTKMPFINPDGTPVRHKQWREDKAGFNRKVRAARAGRKR